MDIYDITLIRRQKTLKPLGSIERLPWKYTDSLTDCSEITQIHQRITLTLLRSIDGLHWNYSDLPTDYS